MNRDTMQPHDIPEAIPDCDATAYMPPCDAEGIPMLERYGIGQDSSMIPL